MIVTLSLTELTNGIVKLYSIRPRPLWVSTKLQRKGSVWEKVECLSVFGQGSWSDFQPGVRWTQDSSFPSSHSQSIATIFSFLLLEGKEHLPYTVWFYACLVTGAFTLLTGFSRAYLAMHFISDVRHRSFSSPFVASVARLG